MIYTAWLMLPCDHEGTIRTETSRDTEDAISELRAAARQVYTQLSSLGDLLNSKSTSVSAILISVYGGFWQEYVQAATN
jgi:hypothetical protein